MTERRTRATAAGEKRSEPEGRGGARRADPPEPQRPRGDAPRRRTRDADFSRAVLEDLYRYRRKRISIAFLLWATTGLMGGHRFYLDRTGMAVGMLFTLGGAGLWWLADAFFIGRMVRAYNEEQERREAAGLAPKALEFMPPLRGARLPPVPAWVGRRGGKLRLVGDVFVLLLAGTGLGAFASDSGNLEPLIAVLALLAVTNFGARWEALAHLPFIGAFDRWNHRLRLFYYTNDPGGPLILALRPIFGIFVAPFRKRARAEARLYLQLGAGFTILFTLFDVLESVAITSSGLDIDPGVFFGDLFQTFFSVYAFAAPIGAILTTHLLLERRDLLLWILSAISLAAIVFGLFGGSLI